MAGVFGLKKVYNRQRVDNWPESANYGYFAGGNTPSVVDTIDRIDFFNETTSAPGNNLSQARQALASVSSSNYGYFGGGISGSTRYCTIDRIDFSNETVAVPPVDNQLTQARNYVLGTFNSNYGYFGGGFATTPPDRVCTIDRLDFSNETLAVPPVGDQLTQARQALASVSSSNYGYFAGGYNPTARSTTIDRLDFSSETVAGPPIHGANLTLARNLFGSVSSSNYGYFAGGTAPTETPSYVATIDRIDFSNETVAAPGNNLTEGRANLAGAFNSNYGYFGGGFDADRVVTIDRIDFSNETVVGPSVHGANLTQARANLIGISGGKSINAKGFKKHRTDISGNPIAKSYGYFVGGSIPPGPVVATIDRIDFSNHTASAPGNNLTQARYGVAAVSNSNYGYIAGGFESNWYVTIDRLDFSNETVVGPSAHGANLIQARAGLAAVSNSNYGYFAGGERFDFECTIDRLDFSTETVAVPSVGDELTKARQFLGAVSNSNYGYFGGGRTPPTVVTIDRIDFSTETVSLPGNNLTQARSGIAGVFSSNYGYFGGGSPSVCTIDRLDFSNETVVGPPDHGSSLTAARSNLAGASNSNYGYFGGGGATIDRIEFPTGTTSPAASLPQSRERLAAVSN